MNNRPGSMIWIVPPCRVLHCTDDSGPAQWRTNTAVPHWTIEWAVCSYHYWQLDDGQKYVSVTENKPSTKRWLVMGDDLIVGPRTTLV